VPVETRDWGLRPYLEALAEMRGLRAARRRRELPDTLLLVEHPEVITVGVQGSEGEVLPSGIPVVPVERGGKATWHGPGQLVGYPIVDLDSRGRDVRRFVHDVEELVVQALEGLGIHAARVPGRRGVWIDGQRKIASVGIAVEEWVTFHGFALNVSNDLAAFRGFHPCGLAGEVMTSAERELGHAVPMEGIKRDVIRAWERVFSDPPREEKSLLTTKAGTVPAPS
jgi:lipoyl(octanoyl) transferase